MHTHTALRDADCNVVDLNARWAAQMERHGLQPTCTAADLAAVNIWRGEREEGDGASARLAA